MDTNRHQTLDVPRAGLEAAVRPALLADVLATLRESGALESYEVGAEMVRISGDLMALEAVLEVEALSDAPGERSNHKDRGEGEGRRDVRPKPTHAALVTPVPVRDARATYYAAAVEHIHTEAFLRLDESERTVWMLHATGEGVRGIAWVVGLSRMAVWRTIRAVRMQAGLPATSGHPRARAPRVAPTCAVEGCPRPAVALGLCRADYKRLVYRAGRPRAERDSALVA